VVAGDVVTEIAVPPTHTHTPPPYSASSQPRVPARGAPPLTNSLLRPQALQALQGLQTGLWRHTDTRRSPSWWPSNWTPSPHSRTRKARAAKRYSSLLLTKPLFCHLNLYGCRSRTRKARAAKRYSSSTPQNTCLVSSIEV
jgi:hypothetical protein